MFLFFLEWKETLLLCLLFSENRLNPKWGQLAIEGYGSVVFQVEISLTQIVDSIESNDVSKLPVLQAMLAFMRKMVMFSGHILFLFKHQCKA